MNELKVFENSEFGELSIMLIDGKEYFPATKCARILGYTNPSKAIRDHCKGVNETFTPSNGGTQKAKFIPEGDLYRLIIRSKLPAAERFERWVFDDVLPNLRKTGSYGQSFNIEEIIIKTVAATVGEVLKQLNSASSPSCANCVAENNLYAAPQSLLPKRKYSSTFTRLDPELRNELDERILSRRYTYVEISEFLSRYGIKISLSAICIYAKRLYAEYL